VTFIDWSDAEGMIDLYQEFVRDEMSDVTDLERRRFLGRVLGDVRSIREAGMSDALEKLRAVHDSIDGEFSSDPAATHLTDLIAELERLA
jgi:hypothetical protein